MDTNLGNNVKKLDGLPGMPGGFAFAMVLLGIALGVLGSVFGGINEYFFRMFGSGSVQVGLQLIEWGAVLQGVLWVCAAFAKKSNPPGAT